MPDYFFIASLGDPVRRWTCMHGEVKNFKVNKSLLYLVYLLTMKFLTSPCMHVHAPSQLKINRQNF